MMTFEKLWEALRRLLRISVDTSSDCAVSVLVAETSVCELNEFLTIFEEYIEEIPKLLPNLVEYACSAVNTLLNFRRKLDEFVLRQSQVDTERLQP